MPIAFTKIHVRYKPEIVAFSSFVIWILMWKQESNLEPEEIQEVEKRQEDVVILDVRPN